MPVVVTSDSGPGVFETLLFPSFPLAEERDAERSDGRVSRRVHQELAVMSAGLTHPDYAALVDPLFAFGEKRVAAIIFYVSNTQCSG